MTTSHEGPTESATPGSPDDAGNEHAGRNTRPPDSDDLRKYTAWLQLLAEQEIGQRFAGKFAPSDVVQQTLLAACRDWNDFRGHDPAQRLAWLRTILAHQLAGLARRFAITAKRDVLREVSLEESLHQTSRHLAGLVAAPGPTPSQIAAAAERQLQLADALARLPEASRTVLTLRHFQDQPFAEIARRMGRSEGAVRMIWLRGVQQLKRAIAPPED